MLQMTQMELVSPKPIVLDLENLSAFERVREQYRHLGVRFGNAIALAPSNPIFTTKSGSSVLMPMENQTSLCAYFDKPTCLVGAFVCGTRIISLKAYDRDGNLLGQNSTSANQTSSPNREAASLGSQLQLNKRGIARVEFHSWMPFTVDDFFFASVP